MIKAVKKRVAAVEADKPARPVWSKWATASAAEEEVELKAAGVVDLVGILNVGGNGVGVVVVAFVVVVVVGDEPRCG